MREIQASERATVERILAAANEEFVPLGGAVTTEDMEALFARLGVAKVILAERDDRPIGCVAYFPPALARSPDEELDALLPPDHAYAGWLAVVPAERRSGVGEALTCECIARARQDGASAIELFTAPYMLAAQRLFERVGFVRQAPPEFPFDLFPYSLEL